MGGGINYPPFPEGLIHLQSHERFKIYQADHFRPWSCLHGAINVTQVEGGGEGCLKVEKFPNC